MNFFDELLRETEKDVFSILDINRIKDFILEELLSFILEKSETMLSKT